MSPFSNKRTHLVWHQTKLQISDTIAHCFFSRSLSTCQNIHWMGLNYQGGEWTKFLAFKHEEKWKEKKKKKQGQLERINWKGYVLIMEIQKLYNFTSWDFNLLVIWAENFKVISLKFQSHNCPVIMEYYCWNEKSESLWKEKKKEKHYKWDIRNCR